MGRAVTRRPDRISMACCSSALAKPGLIEPSAVLAAVKTAARRLRRLPSASLDCHCARRSAIAQAGTEKRPQAEQRNLREIYKADRNRPAERRTLFMIRLPDQTVDRIGSVAAAERMSVQEACLQRRGWHVRVSVRAYVERHSGCGSWDRAAWPHVPNDRS